ncbi:hypothetical protein FACS1894122_01210 [Alphaproteobacteria bacterium]|nr:hypothetical protein FACS1894122_01210 [Alphaproteobacteria bacterium]
MKINKSIVACASAVVVVSFGIAEGMNETPKLSPTTAEKKISTLVVHPPVLIKPKTEGILLAFSLQQSSGLSPQVEIKTKMTWKRGKYIGQANSSRIPHGYGRLTYTSGENFIGDWVNGEFVKGKHTCPGGNFYEGEWQNGGAHGTGKHTCTNGTVYEGELRNGKKNGHGIKVLANGERFEGEWFNNELVKGKHSCPDGSVYDGEWRNRRANGKGKYTRADKSVYDGEWLNGKENGKGTLTLANGEKQVGDWINGKFVNNNDIVQVPSPSNFSISSSAANSPTASSISPVTSNDESDDSNVAHSNLSTPVDNIPAHTFFSLLSEPLQFGNDEDENN